MTLTVNRSLLRRVALLGAASLVGSLAVLAAAGPAAVAGTRPMPVDPAHARSAQSDRSPAQRPVGSVTHNPLLKEVLGEEDEGAEAPEPALSALCQSFLGQPNPYPAPAPNVDQIVGDTVVPVGSQAGCSAAQNETTIAVDPNDPRHIVAGANDYRIFNTREGRNDSHGWAYVSFDGGASWTDVALPKLDFQTGGEGPFSYFDGSGDPVIGFGPDGTVYYGTIAFSRVIPAVGQQASAIIVSVSHDGGLSWDDPSAVQVDGVSAGGTPEPTDFFNDKLWLAADQHSGRLYVTWTKFTFNDEGDYLESPILLKASDDRGQHFGPAVRISPSLDGFTGGITPYAQGSNPQVGNDGALYVAYEASVCATAACDQADDRDATIVATSTDLGGTFSQTIVDTNYDFPENDDTGTATLTGENFRINSYPQLAYDRETGALHVTWSDDRNGQYDPATGESVRSNGDNIVSTSRDGRRWSRPIAVGTPQDEVFGAVAAFDGHVAVTSYTRHYDPNGIGLDYAYWAGGSGQGLRNAPIRRITTATQDPQVQFLSIGFESGEVLQGVFIGDYSAVAVGSDLRIHPCWTDFRGSPGTNTPNQDAYTQTIALDD
jgi:hypothetical protein